MKPSFKKLYVKYRTYTSTLFIVLALASLFINKDKDVNVMFYVTMGLAVVNIFFNSIPEINYTKAARAGQQRTEEGTKESLKLYENAMSWGLRPQQEIVVGTIQLQYGNMERGKEILESYIHDENQKLSDAVKISLSMYYWMKKDLDKAIALCEEAYQHGFKETNLYINLCTYYLEKGRIKDFEKCYKEAFDNKMGSVV
ncbi:MAG: hypothetical protein KBS81_03690, partial [Spirochaetales bacterium]|nr:hypothetical protein [Candidatus Physcosoma equi]